MTSGQFTTFGETKSYALENHFGQVKYSAQVAVKRRDIIQERKY